AAPLLTKFGHGAKQGSAAFHSTLDDDGQSEVAALEASMKLATADAENMFQLLVDDQPREAMVTSAKALMQVHIDHINLLLPSLGDDKKQGTQPAIEALSQKVLLIIRWINGRQGNAQITEHFSSVVAATNKMRQEIGLDAVDLHEAKDFPER